MAGAVDYHPRQEYWSWGRVQRPQHRVARPAFRDELPPLLSDTAETPLLAVGCRRSYGDTCLNGDGRLIDMTSLDRIIAFDRATGVLRAEAGLSLDALLRLTVPLGWFAPVVPGTRHVTLGGAVANDVHGKNHHVAGSFGCHIRRLALRRTDGACYDIGPDGGPLFAATVGGLGLTGVIEWIELQLAPIRSAEVEGEDVVFARLEDFFALARESEAWPFTVAWVDCAAPAERRGRGIFSRARWAEHGPLTPHGGAGLPVPIEAPGFLLNRHSLHGFNALYLALGRRRAGRLRRQHYAPFFFPLDRLSHWNRLYGRRGMFQYQCVVPMTEGASAVGEILDAIAVAGDGSFLAVLKTFGAIPSPGMLSFPREGVTLALDFPNRGASTEALLARLDAIVQAAGGRLYPAKDGRMPTAMFRAGYPAWTRLAELIDPGIRSDFWRRVAV